MKRLTAVVRGYLFKNNNRRANEQRELVHVDTEIDREVKINQYRTYSGEYWHCYDEHAPHPLYCTHTSPHRSYLFEHNFLTVVRLPCHFRNQNLTVARLVR